jgi:hypothetical protein
MRALPDGYEKSEEETFERESVAAAQEEAKAKS